MRAAQEMLELFSQAARSVAGRRGYTYDQPEEAGIRAYMEQVQRRSLKNDRGEGGCGIW